jgi:hypothetical protein
VLSAATSAKLGACLKANVATGAHLLTGAVERLGRLVEGNLTGDPVYCDTQQTLPGFRP